MAAAVPRRKTRWIVALGAGGMLGAGTLAPLSASAVAAQGTPPEVVTPLVATPLSSPHPVVGSDRRVHLAYELFVTNPTQSVMKLEKLETLGAGGRNSLERGARIIAALTDQDLDGATKPFVPGSTLTLAPAQVTRLFLDARFARTARLPRRLKHRFTFTLWREGAGSWPRAAAPRPPTTEPRLCR
jgi:hypothetical protein